MQLTNYLEFLVNNGWLIISTIVIILIIIFLFTRKIILRNLSMGIKLEQESKNAEITPEISDTPDSDKNDEIKDESKQPLGSELSKIINLERFDPFESHASHSEGVKFSRAEKNPRITIAFEQKPHCSPVYYSSPPEQKVEFAVFAPQEIARGSKFVLEIWAYHEYEYGFVLQTTKEAKLDNIGVKHGTRIISGILLKISITIEKLKIDEATETFFWNGDPTNIQFFVNVPSDILIGDYFGSAVISHSGITLAKIKFIITIENSRINNFINTTREKFYPTTAFASYANENRTEVLSRMQGMNIVAPDLEIFFDVFSLRSGENWQKKLEKEVIDKDIFYLFWSRYAAKSIWVEREWKLALNNRGLDYIDPIPLEDVRDAPPPEELKSLHFHDFYIPYIQYENSRLIGRDAPLP